MSQTVIFKNVTKKYKMYNKNSEKLLDIVFPDGYGEDFYALQNISFTAEKGDVIGIIGVNGAGKSTLSNLITGVIPPTSGEMEIKGQASLIAIASGLDNKLTGRENIELKCLMLGFNKAEIRELMPEIIEFADIGKFIDQPVKSYSSGMKSRLGFAISVNIDPDVLVIDEALSVGDQTFADKCLDKMNEFKEKGKTIFFISHSIGQVKKFCQKALWLEAGEVRAYGAIGEIVPMYERFLKEFKAMSKEDQKNFKQLVLEKRSKLREQESQTLELNEQDEKIPRKQTRTNRKRNKGIIRLAKRIIVSLIVFTGLLGGAAYAVKSGLFPDMKSTDKSDETDREELAQKQQAEEINDKTIEEPDIRYINVEKANIRTQPDINSQSNGMAVFGEGYLIQDLQQETPNSVEWLKITDKEGREGWISSKIVTLIPDEINGQEVSDKIDELIGFIPALSEAIPMLGKQKGEEEPFNYTEYKYQNDKVSEFTILVSDSSEYELVNAIGEPQLRFGNILLYHGSDYDFIITIGDGGLINTLTVANQPS
ncbi:teichoic acid transport system ATP-binding protein [Cytobacillus firmus]|uniref:Teichoic acid transport system ATP-binding protein n=2 Tax=Cytobacillus TaxID=2675230 RepID=A0A366JTR1_CYTFI|nr:MULTISPECIES: teichoic acids export ABC transporter ATP-binding subunit TagH [Cytobacillus]RBP91543.1 teichoic acid transport system ATP-binding protein [Cytobacillus firmus]TDX41743.1 teichoic acid transport system ATP-binding protein [Cytobacillus oceanisediminis]